MGKRGNNEGTFRQRPNGQWEARISLPGRKRKSIYGRTREEVAAEWTKQRGTLNRGGSVPTGRQTLAQFLDDWLEHVVKQRNRPKTYDSYESIVRVHLVPALGKQRLSSLSTQQVQRFLTQKALTASPRVTQYCRDVLRIALAQALRWGLVSQNAAVGTEPPRLEEREIQPLSRDEARAILAAFAGNALEMPVMLALALGLRRGEVLGLRWRDVGLDAGTLSVRHQAQWIDRQWRFVEPKSRQGRRTLPLPAFVADALREHRAHQLEARLRAGPAWLDYDLVCPSEVGTPQHGVNVTRRFQRRLKQAGLPRMRFHDLRHGAATTLLAHGASLREIMAVLGHSQLSTTLKYAHVAPELMRVNAERMQQALGE